MSNVKDKDETRFVGQFIPIQYHFAMLNDTARMVGFREACNIVIQPEDAVLELGGGTGVLSFYAAQKARKVYCVEYNLDLVEVARRNMTLNPNGDKVEVIHGDGFEYVPPEPVAVVICEMLHVGLLREKQLEMIDAFKARYKKHYPEHPLPIFIPGATLQAVQPVHEDFTFEGYYAPVIQFQEPTCLTPRTTPLGDPVVYHQLVYDQPYELDCKFDGVIPITATGTVNAIRVITKSVLAVNSDTGQLVEWHNQYLIHPLENPVEVEEGQNLSISFAYDSGAQLSAFDPVVKLL